MVELGEMATRNWGKGRGRREDAMPKEIEIDEIRPLLDAGAQLVEVLPEAEYEEEHLPGAINIPLKQMTREAVAGLEKDRAVIVYCWDYL
jgi:rhodanese-related sulfurtransferase